MKAAAALSFWEREVFFGTIDLIIVGSGIVGLNAAIRLKELSPDLRIVVLERSALAAGASTRNAGFACFGSMTELLEDCEKNGEDACFSLVEERWRGLQLLRQRIGDVQLDLKAYGGYEMFRETEKESFEKCMDAMPKINRYLVDIIGHKEVFVRADQALGQMGFRSVSHLIFNQSEGQLNPGKMMAALIQMARQMGIQIINGLEVVSLTDDGTEVVLQTDAAWELRAARVLVATNGFARQLLPELQLRPARNQVMITKPIKHLPFQSCFHYDRGYYYFRNVGNRLLLGGGRHLFEQEEYTEEFGMTEAVREHLLELVREVILPSTAFEPDCWWSGILGVGDSKKPIVKKVSERLFVAVRLGGMGVAIGSSVGRQAAALMLSSMD